MNEAPTTAARRTKRAKALRIALAVFLACYVSIYGASALFSVTYRYSTWAISLEHGALQGCLLAGPSDRVKAYITKLGTQGWSWQKNQTTWFAYLPAYHETTRQFGFDIGGVGETHTRVDIWKRTFHSLSIPLWLPLLPLLALAAFLIHRDRTRRPPGHCKYCNYNLTGNTSGRCPECGNPTGADGQIGSASSSP